MDGNRFPSLEKIEYSGTGIFRFSPWFDRRPEVTNLWKEVITIRKLHAFGEIIEFTTDGGEPGRTDHLHQELILKLLETFPLLPEPHITTSGIRRVYLEDLVLTDRAMELLSSAIRSQALCSVERIALCWSSHGSADSAAQLGAVFTGEFLPELTHFQLAADYKVANLSPFLEAIDYGGLCRLTDLTLGNFGKTTSIQAILRALQAVRDCNSFPHINYLRLQRKPFSLADLQVYS